MYILCFSLPASTPPCVTPSLNNPLLMPSHRYSFFTLPICLSSQLPPSYVATFCFTCPPSYPVPLTVFVTHSSPTTSTPSPLLLALTDPMCALCSRSWGLKRSTSAHVGTGTKAPSAARRRKSSAKDSMD